MRSFATRWASWLVATALIVGLAPLGVVASPDMQEQQRSEAAALALFPSFANASYGRAIPDASSIVVGTVTDAGVPVSGATVLLSALPSTASRIATGMAELSPVAMGSTGRNGEFSLASPMTSELSSRREADGSILFEVDVITADGTLSVFTFDAFMHPGRRGWVHSRHREHPVLASVGAATASVARDIVSLNFDLSSNKTTVPVEGLADSVLEPEYRHHQLGNGVCTSWALYSTSKDHVVVAEHGLTPGKTAQVVYNTSASTTLSNGIQIGGAGASWQANGTSTKTSGATGTFVQQSGPSSGYSQKAYEVEWRYSTYERHCGVGDTGGYQIQRETYPDFATGGFRIVSTPYTQMTCLSANRATVSGVSSVSTSTATATTYGSSFSASIGGATFTGTSRSGYNSSTKITYGFPSGSGTWCGDNNVPLAANRVRTY